MAQQSENIGYWDGALWIYHSQITNGAGGGGTISVLVVPTAGNEMEILSVEVVNGDTAARNAQALIRTSGDKRLVHLITSVSVAAAASRTWPTAEVAADDGSRSGGTRCILAGDMRLFMDVASVAASEDASFAVIARVRGSPPHRD